MSPQRAYEILVSAANYCMVFMEGWDAFDEIIIARRNIIRSTDEIPLSDDDFESFSLSNLLRWQYIRRINGHGGIRAIESEAA